MYWGWRWSPGLPQNRWQQNIHAGILESIQASMKLETFHALSTPLNVYKVLLNNSRLELFPGESGAIPPFLVSMLMYPRPIASLTGHPDVLMEPTRIILECKVDVLMIGGNHHIATKRLVLMS